MTTCSKEEREAKDVERRINKLRARAYVQKDQDCKVVLVECQKCKRTYYETLKAAEVIVICLDGFFLCIACDGSADKTASPRLTLAGFLATS